MIALIDYGAGNIFSVKNALDFLGIENKLTNNADEIRNADAIILPGVGAFGWAMNMLEKSGLIPVLKEEAKKKPFLGICLGMQVLFEKGYEFGEFDGLGLIPGSVKMIEDEGLIVPHMGWNKLEITSDSPIMKGITNDDYVYFVHSYKAFCDKENLVAYCEYGSPVSAMVTDGGYVYGAQFHPEKSGTVGLKILSNFASMIGEVK
ncbi:MAG: imidazole glycerol phosphate synthase subunit HisH [Oscillospiraceae bacterium]|nr:imidazole glycerol phosphate synthase subunit HisH [Oscillospiraceae bacterium]